VKADVRIVVKSNRLRAIGRQMHRELGKAVAETAFVVEGNIKANIVEKDLIDTGALLNDILAEKESDLTWFVTTSREYAAYPEYGTYAMAARPYFTPGVEAARRFFRDRCRDAIRKVA
jgi:phage gpG-like protein